MALQKEVWIQDIQENLYQGNEFLTRSVDDSGYISSKTVHLPQSGALASITVNRSSLPASIAQRTDTELTYSMSEFTIDPTLITDIDSLQVSYDKRMSVLRDHLNGLQDAVASTTLYAWAPSGTASRVVSTTGASSSTALAPAVVAGRKAITLADIANARAILDKDNVPQTGRILVIPSDMYNGQILAIDNLMIAQNYGSANLPTGVVKQIYGFDIYIRPAVLVYDNAQTLKTLNSNGVAASPAATDMLAALAYHPNYVSKALGSIKAFANEDKAEYYGSIFSALVMHGAKYRRTDLKGVVSIIQVAA
jgi:hypothetical protein